MDRDNDRERRELAARLAGCHEAVTVLEQRSDEASGDLIIVDCGNGYAVRFSRNGELASGLWEAMLLGYDGPRVHPENGRMFPLPYVPGSYAGWLTNEVLNYLRPDSVVRIARETAAMPERSVPAPRAPVPYPHAGVRGGGPEATQFPGIHLDFGSDPALRDAWLRWLLSGGRPGGVHGLGTAHHS